MKKILFCFGTRPEAIKLAPLVKSLSKNFQLKICVTGQHRKMLDQALLLFGIQADYDLKVMKKNQDLFYITTKIISEFKDVLLKEKPDLTVVHGDTTTTMAASLASFYLKIPIAHVEAGLRTNDLYSPFPEELNRSLVSKIAKYHFAPTKEAKFNLVSENIPSKNIFVTGNTVIDSLFLIVKKSRKIKFTNTLIKKMPFLNKVKINKNIILVTGHRRENFGIGFKNICKSIKEIAYNFPEFKIIYPVHLNPNVKKPVEEFLSNIKNVYLIEPLDYLYFVKLIDISYLIITDSGGIQEEAPSLNKPVLVMRDKTERPEAITSGTARIVGTKIKKIVQETRKLIENKEEYEKMISLQNPYGDGKASQRIAKILEKHLI